MTGQPRRPSSDTRWLARVRRPRPATRRPRTAAEVGVRRIRWLLGIYVLVILVIVGQLATIQLVRADEYADRGVRQRARTVELPATRGRIYDREGDVLATSVQAATVYADPRAYRATTTDDGTPVPPAGDAAAVATELAAILDLDPTDLQARLERDAHFVYVARQLDHEVGEQVQALGLPGIGVLTEPRRVYPAGGLAGQVVGFTGIDGEGLQGLEAQYDALLRGKPGMLALERAPGGLDIASGFRELVPPEVGSDLVLTLDRQIQHAAERAAADTVEGFAARGASVVVLEVGSGEVLAMASAPSYDPNVRLDGDHERWRNRAVTDVFEPGSTQKMLTIAAAIEEGLVDATSEIPVPYALRISGKTFTDAYVHPDETWELGEVLERSSNTGTIDVGLRLGPERLEAYLRDFGYGTTTGSGFPGEAPGLLMPHESWWGTSLPTISIGQGVAVTLLQLADAYATIANDGVAVTPRVVRGTVGEDGRLVPTNRGTQRQVVSEDTAREVRTILERVTSGERGTGKRGAVAGYRVAAKTGTARKPNDDARGYSDEYFATFVGMAPVDDPRLVVAVMVDEPRPYYGGIAAAPLFREVMETALIALQVPPDTPGGSLSDALVAAEQQAADLEAAAAQEGPAVDAHDPASPPVGTPAGGDGAPVGARDEGG